VLGFSYDGPRAHLYRSVCITGTASAALLAVSHVLNAITPNDFSIGLLLIAVSEFAVGVGILATLLFLVLAFFRDAPNHIKLFGLAAALFPYLVVASLWLIATITHSRS
jgi:hypothetical protein